MKTELQAMDRLIFEFSKLPGIGEKTATRLVYHIITQKEPLAENLALALLEVQKKVAFCSVCYTFSEHTRCDICSSPKRDSNIICVVERPSDVHAIEKTGKFHGTYHVLQGALSPLNGIGPEQLKIQELLNKVIHSQVQEVILAMNFNVEGEATALYLFRVLKNSRIKVSQLASGLPVGSHLEYADQQTIGRAIENRMEIHL